MRKRKAPSKDDPYEIIFRRFRRDPKSGRVMDARCYGLAAWPIRIRRVKKPRH